MALKVMQREPDRPLRAWGWMLASALGFSVMSIFVKNLAVKIPAFELVFFRSLINFLILLPVLALSGEPMIPPSGKLLLVFRGVAGFAGASCLFYGIGHLPLSVASIINWSSPLFVIVFSRIFLAEKIRPSSVLWIGLAFVGLVLLVRPDSAMSRAQISLGAVGITILGAAFGGLAYVAVRAATARVGVNTIIFYFTGISALLSAPLAAMDFYMPTSSEALQLGIMGLFASFGQFAMTHGYRYAPAPLVSTMSLMNAGFAAFFGWVIFGETLTSLQWSGMVIMASAIAKVTVARIKPAGEPNVHSASN